MEQIQGQFDELRLLFFVGIFVLMALAELFIPKKRKLTIKKSKRWSSNFLLSLSSTLGVKLLLPFTSISVALFAQEHGIGLFNMLKINPAVSGLTCVIIFDLIIYWQHRLFHIIPFFWRFHSVHHADKDYDVTTGFRFHPIEIILSMIIKFASILLLGASPLIVVIFEIILNALAMFNHSNIRLGTNLDNILRKIIVTPDFHRVHHSVRADEHHKNYGFNLAIWDYLFQSYKANTTVNQTDMPIGLREISDDFRAVNWFGMLLSPFTKGK